MTTDEKTIADYKKGYRNKKAPAVNGKDNPNIFKSHFKKYSSVPCPMDAHYTFGRHYGLHSRCVDCNEMNNLLNDKCQEINGRIKVHLDEFVDKLYN